jgi:hypothetical protein
MVIMSRSSLSLSNKSLRSRRLLFLIVAVVVSFVVFGDVFAIPSPYMDLLEESLVSTPTGDIEVKMNAFEPNKISPMSEPNGILPMKLYHHYYIRGKSGAVIHDMLLCHAYAWHQKLSYGGSCGEWREQYNTHESLLESIGLKEELPFACPRDPHRNATGFRGRVVPKEEYRQDDTRMWIPEYVEFLKARVKYPPKVPDKHTIAVHIRRGNAISPCEAQYKGFERYLPNSHYQRLIDKYIQPDSRVVIFSQNKSHEPFDEFRSKGYEVYLDDDITDVWKTIVVSDVVILSRSSFSLIPAVVTKAKIVVYTPFWHKPLRSWHVVRDKSILDMLDADTAQLRSSCPTHNKFGGKMRGGG